MAYSSTKRIRTNIVGFWVSCLVLTLACAARADDYSAGWGPEIGAAMPLLAAVDQSGQLRELDNLRGEQGLLLFLNRSADW